MPLPSALSSSQSTIPDVAVAVTEPESVSPEAVISGPTTQGNVQSAVANVEARVCAAASEAKAPSNIQPVSSRIAPITQEFRMASDVEAPGAQSDAFTIAGE